MSAQGCWRGACWRRGLPTPSSTTPPGPAAARLSPRPLGLRLLLLWARLLLLLLLTVGPCCTSLLLPLRRPPLPHLWCFWVPSSASASCLGLCLGLCATACRVRLRRSCGAVDASLRLRHVVRPASAGDDNSVTSAYTTRLFTFHGGTALARGTRPAARARARTRARAGWRPEFFLPGDGRQAQVAQVVWELGAAEVSSLGRLDGGGSPRDARAVGGARPGQHADDTARCRRAVVALVTGLARSSGRERRRRRRMGG